MRAFNRLALRLRLTLAFAGVMAVVLAATGTFLYVRLGNDLDATINQGLRSRVGDVTALVKQADSGLTDAGRSPLTEQGESLAQILTLAGVVLDSTPGLHTTPLLDATEIARSANQTLTVERASTPAGDDPVRLLATGVRAQGQDLVVVVGTSLENRREAARNLAGLLLLGGPIALLLASAAGYGLAAAALRPVDRMRRQADAIQAAKPGERLEVPAANDEIGRLGSTLNAMLDRLEAAFARERTFVSDASHELRTPLAILKTELELALRAQRTPAEREDALRSAAEETDRLVQLAEDLLVIARTDQGRLPIRREPVDVAEALHATVTRFERRARDAHVAVTVDAAPGLTLPADDLRLQQALGNLLDNSLRHAARSVELRADAAPGWVTLSVIDDGDGFPDEFLDSAFERFTRSDASRGRSGGGAGLGLAIVRAIATVHGGTVGAANAAHGGAIVWLKLPDHEGEDERAATAKST